MTRMLVEILADHVYLGLSHKCVCGNPTTTRQEWAAHVRDEIAFEGALDDFEHKGIDLRKAIEVLTEAIECAEESRHGSADCMVFGYGYMTGSVQRALRILLGSNLIE